MGKNWKSTKHRKTRGFLALPGGRRQGRRPLSPTERRETPSAMPRPGGPWPDLRAAAPAADPGKVKKPREVHDLDSVAIGCWLLLALAATGAGC